MNETSILLPGTFSQKVEALHEDKSTERKSDTVCGTMGVPGQQVNALFLIFRIFFCLMLTVACRLGV
jgi:hypothetical protein